MRKICSLIVLVFLALCVMGQTAAVVSNLIRPTSSLPSTCVPYSARSTSSGLRVCNAAGNGWNYAGGAGSVNVASGKTLTVSNSLTLAGTDSTTVTFPSTSATVARTDTGQTFTGINTFLSAITAAGFSSSGGVVSSQGGTVQGRQGNFNGEALGNSLYWGHSNQGYKNTIGALSSTGYPFVCFYCYHGTTANTMQRSSASNLPIKVQATNAGSIEIYTAPAGTADADISDFTKVAEITKDGVVLQTGVTFANLPGTPTNGMLIYCSNCTKATPCASGGSGAMAKRLNGAWDCD